MPNCNLDNNLVISIATVVDGDFQNVMNYLQRVTSLLSKNFRHYEVLLIIKNSSHQDKILLRNSIQQLLKIRVIELANNCSDDIAYGAALNSAIGDAVILMDFNQDSLSPVLLMINKVLHEGANIVIGHNTKKNKESLLSRWLSKLFYKCTALLCGQIACFSRNHFSCYSRTAINFILQHKNNVCNLRLLREQLGLEVTLVEYSDSLTQKRNSRAIIQRLFSNTEGMLYLSVKPLRIVSALGFILAIYNIFYIGYIFIINLFGDNTQYITLTSTSLIKSIGFLILFFSISVIASYLNIILQEIQRRPLYTISNEWFSDNVLFDFSKKNVVDN
jgi:hypothetical protein